MNAPRRPRAQAGALLRREAHGWRARFPAMGGHGELLIDTPDRDLAAAALRRARTEVERIEARYSRYRSGNWMDRLNRGERMPLDPETAGLLDLADALHLASDGRFDVTSGVLRAVWPFPRVTAWPEPDAVTACVHRIGWPRVDRTGDAVRLPAGMELDLGGLGKEYAVDRAADRIAACGVPFVFGLDGDLRVHGPRSDGSPWSVGLARPGRTDRAESAVAVHRGALATSGSAHQFVMRDGRRHGHLLDPGTGYPVPDVPLAVTVFAGRCLEAGSLATLAALQGAGAEAFLEGTGVRFRCRREDAAARDRVPATQ